MKTIITFFFFFAIILYGSSQPEFTKHIISSNANGAAAATAVDMDKDGDLDVVTGEFDGNKISWYENNGNQGFEMHTIATGEVGVVWVMAIDLDKDGDVDVISSTSSSDRLAWHENDGAQNFSTHLIAVLDLAHMFDIADIDNDGDLDICEAAGLGDYTAWFENDGAQNFTKHVITAAVNNPQQVRLADIDEDGDIDAFTASAGSNHIVWHKNDGAQNFENIVLIGVQDPTRLHIIDLDGDNDLDILAGLGETGQLNWYENDGNESFTSHIIATNVVRVMRIDAADLDNDGDQDILCASREDNLVVWYENDGEQNFTAHTLSNTSQWALSVFASDIDSDGDLDVLSASYNDNTVAWYENNLIDTVPEFKRYEYNPILPLGGSGQWDRATASNACVLKIDGTYHMWYDGSTSTQSFQSDIGYATSQDGIHWEKYSGNPVLERGGNGQFDDYSAEYPCVIYNGSSFEMWYTASTDNGQYAIGYASSDDGINWVKHSGNPVLRRGSGFESNSVGKPSVIWNDSIYQMWYFGNSSSGWQTGYATSTDGINWEKYSGNPVLKQGKSGEWDSNAALSSTVLYDSINSKYEMWYQGNTAGFTGIKIGYASSLDGIHWTKYSKNPILSVSSGWEAVNVYFPFVLKEYIGDSSFYHMYYSGRGFNNAERLGLATTDLSFFEDVGYTKLIKNWAFLSQNHPNPFSSKTTVGYELPVSGKVRLSVYDIFGKELEVLIDANQKQGAYEVEWNATGMPTGIYFYRISMDGQWIETRKMILSR